MFADDTNLFYSHSDVKTLFNIVNNEKLTGFPQLSNILTGDHVIVVSVKLWKYIYLQILGVL